MYSFAAVCGRGAQPWLENEILQYGGVIKKISPTYLEFDGPLEAAYRLLLWSRVATRVILILHQCEVEHQDQFTAGLSKVDWNSHIPPGAAFSVKCSFSKGSPWHEVKTAGHVRRHIEQSLQSPPDWQPQQPQVLVHGLLYETRWVLGIDLSGESLHKRGYRMQHSEAALKETLAATILLAAHWPFETDCVIDPMCGSGTLLIEAARLWAGLPAHAGRDYFGCLGWRQHDARLWDALTAETEAAMEQAHAKKWPRFIGYDANPTAVKVALQQIKDAGLAGKIHIERQAIHALVCDPNETGFILMNPPYGQRLGEMEALPYLYQYAGRKLKTQCQGWHFALMSSEIQLLDALGLGYEHQHRFNNGPLPLFVRIGQVGGSPVGRITRLEPRVEDPELLKAPDLARRLEKNYRRLKNFEPRCYRLYDADIPEYNFALDIYEHCLHVQEYKAPKTIDPEKAQQRLSDALQTLSLIFRIPAHRIFLKQRQQQKKQWQYSKRDAGQSGKNEKKTSPGVYAVEEWGVQLLVNLEDYLDTGLFLDHRNLRRHFQEIAKGKHMLNLFAYTGAASVQAAAGGAKTTTSVDLSQSYCQWARANLALNGFSEVQHQVINADVMQWLTQTRNNYDLIFIDPPTFSNSKKARDFAVQEDHTALLELAMKHLDLSGVLYFSCNFKKFKLDAGLEQRYSVKEISHWTHSPDFDRSQGGHRCWEIRFRSH